MRHRPSLGIGSALISDAYEAARHGRIDDVHEALARFRMMTGTDTAAAEELTRIACCVRAHPSFREGTPGEQAAS